MKLEAEVAFIDHNHKIAVLVFTENHDAIMLPLDLLPEGLQAGQMLSVTVEVR